jgi:hypothetical protein
MRLTGLQMRHILKEYQWCVTTSLRFVELIQRAEAVGCRWMNWRSQRQCGNLGASGDIYENKGPGFGNLRLEIATFLPSRQYRGGANRRFEVFIGGITPEVIENKMSRLDLSAV